MNVKIPVSNVEVLSLLIKIPAKTVVLHTFW